MQIYVILIDTLNYLASVFSSSEEKTFKWYINSISSNAISRNNNFSNLFTATRTYACNYYKYQHHCHLVIGPRNIHIGVGFTIALPSYKNFMMLDLGLRTDGVFFN